MSVGHADTDARFQTERWQRVSEYANALNAGEIERVGSLLSQEVRYESQMVLSALRGKHEVIEYLSGKMATLARSPDARITAVLADFQGDPSIIVHQFGRPSCLLLFEFDASGLICGIDLCVAPGPSDAIPVR